MKFFCWSRLQVVIACFQYPSPSRLEESCICFLHVHILALLTYLEDETKRNVETADIFHHFINFARTFQNKFYCNPLLQYRYILYTTESLSIYIMNRLETKNIQLLETIKIFIEMTILTY